jgi:hypothetical protein
MQPSCGRLGFTWIITRHNRLMVGVMPQTQRDPTVPTFTRIGEMFTIYGSPLHIGAVIASADAIYFVAYQEPFGFKSLFTGKLGQAITSPTEYFPTPLSELDSAITSDPSWGLPDASAFAFVLSKNDVVRISKPLLQSVTITSDRGRIKIRRGVSQRFPVRDALATLGWSWGAQ